MEPDSEGIQNSFSIPNSETSFLAILIGRKEKQEIPGRSQCAPFSLFIFFPVARCSPIESEDGGQSKKD
jgi:hypothetical protein